MDLVLMGGAILSKSLIQFCGDGQDCVSSQWFHLRPNYGGSNEDNLFLDYWGYIICIHSRDSSILRGVGLNSHNQEIELHFIWWEC